MGRVVIPAGQYEKEQPELLFFMQFYSRWLNKPCCVQYQSNVLWGR